jgi:hypothetical protein
MLDARDGDGLSHPGSKAGKLQRLCLERLCSREGVPDALPTSMRFIYYELVQLGHVAKHKRADEGGRQSDQDVIDAVSRLRKIRVVPWSWIVDETRDFTVWPFHKNILAGVIAAAEWLSIDAWGGARPPVILTESRSLAGVLRALTARYLAPIAATNGQVGGFLHTDIAPRLIPGDRAHYLGDQDFQGGQIEDNTRRVLERLIGGELDWQRLAITPEQVREHDLPVIQKPDRRFRPVRFHDAVETEALADVLEREEAERERVKAALARLRRRWR